MLFGVYVFFLESSLFFFWNWKYTTRKNLQTFVGSGPKSCDSRSFGLMWPPFELAKEREIRADPSWMTFCFFGFTSTIPNYLLGGAALETDVLHGDLGVRSNSWSLYKCRPYYDPVGWCPRLTYKLVVLVGWTDSFICLLSACKKADAPKICCACHHTLFLTHDLQSCFRIRKTSISSAVCLVGFHWSNVAS